MVCELLQGLDSEVAKTMLDVNIFLTDAKVDPASGLLKIGMDLVGKTEKSDVLTGLSAKTNFGRPRWDSTFDKIAAKTKLNRTNVFFCGPYPLGRTIRMEARKVGFHFRMENF